MDETGRFNVLVVDDDSGVRDLCGHILDAAGYGVSTAETAEAAREALEAGDIDVVLTDLCLSNASGLDLLREIRPQASTLDVVLMTGHGTIETAVAAMKLGAYDFLTKPFSAQELLRCIEHIAERRRAQMENLLLREQIQSDGRFAGMVGRSARMQALFRSILQVAPRRQAVLITGESGTGKELAARAVHELSPWRHEPFVAIDCGGLSSTLIEAELFGHVRGAFTGAVHSRPGLIAMAGRGTVFFDEIGELPPELQVKLLRVLQERQYRPVGGDQVFSIEARVVAATNVDLEAAVAAGSFRRDLYYRLNVHRLSMPALRERRSDIRALFQHMFAKHEASPTPAFSADALSVLMRYAWPGNVRELENCALRLLASGSSGLLEVADLPAEILAQAGLSEAVESRGYLAEVERTAILEMLETSGGNCAQAARLLGVAKTTVYRKLREYGITPSADPAGDPHSSVCDRSDQLIPA